MAEYNLTIQMEKYSAAEVEADIQNLDAELADESSVNSMLASSGAAERSDAVRKFLADNKERISDQHDRMQSRVRALRDIVSANQQLEGTDAEYKALIEGEDAQLVARLLTEMNAMSLQYREFLLEAGRAGRPPLF